MAGDLRSTLKAGLYTFLVIFGFNMITTLPTSVEQIIPAVLVSAVAALVMLVGSWIYWSYKDRKSRRDKHGD